MTIETTIKNMEEALEKKKAVMREKSAGKITKLKERIKVKTAKIEKITREREGLEAEVAGLVGDQNVAGAEATTETPFIPGKAAEGDKKDDNKKTSPKKK